MKIPNLKNVALVLLSLLVVVQAGWIANMQSTTVPLLDTPEVIDIRMSPNLSGFEVELAAPVDTAVIEASTAASLSPAVEGEWTWATPYLLQFTAAERFDTLDEYTVTMADTLGIEGERTFELQTNSFKLKELTLSERAGSIPGSAIISAFLSFNSPVSPEDLLQFVTLTDQATGSPVELQVMSSWSSREVELRSAPVQKTPQGATYRLEVIKGLKRSGTELALRHGGAKTIDLRLDPVLRFIDTQPWSSPAGNGVSLVFSTPMNAQTAAGFISVTPKADYTLAADESSLTLNGGFTTGEQYTITLRQGLTAADGAVLDEGVSQQVGIPDADPAADFVGTGMFLPSNASSGLVIEAVNTPQVNLQVDRVFPNNLFTMLSEYGWDIFENSWGYSGVSNSLGGTLFEDTLSTEGELNQTVRLPVSLANTFDTTDRGLYKVNLSMGDGYGTNRWLILTDIGLVAKRDENSFLVWAVSNTTLQPLPSIRLTLVSDKNQQLARATTSQTGTATLNIPSETAKGTVFMILAEGASNDFTFLLPDRFGVDTTGLDVTGATASPSGLKAFLYGERDLYRPGETFKGMAIVRKGDLSAPEQMPLILIQRDPKGREIRRLRLDTSSQGTAAIELPIPDYTLTGGHTLELLAGDSTIGTMDFKVEEFVPDRIKVELTTDSDSVALGQTYEVNVQSNYLFGPPAAELPVTAHAVLRQTPFVAKGFEDYAFGNPDMRFEPQEFFSQDATLDKEGHTVFSLALPGGLTPPAALEATVYGRVSESGGRGVTARKSVIVHPYSYYVGLKKLDKNGYEYNKPINFDFVTTDPKGIPCAHGKLQARLYQDRWRTVVRKSPSGGYRYESVNDPQLLTATNIPAATGKGNVQFTPPGYGSYRVEVVSPESGASAQASFYCGGWGYSPWALENPARIELVTDREQYRPGETATIQVRAPFAGRLLVAVEGDKVHDTRVIALDGNTGEVSFPVKASYAPNVHVTALLVRKASDVSEGSVGRAFGALPLLVDNLSNKMPMTLSGPDEIRPESELTVVVDAEPGAVVTVAAVDEGIMQLSGSDDPTPFDFFYARRALGVESYDTFAMLYPDLARIMGKATAGGGAALLAESQFMRTEGIRRIIPVSFWSGPLTAGADGKVRYRMRLPDFQGALRVVAVGQDGKRFGTARTMTRVRSPLAVTPTLPRFLATGDSIEMPITLRNDMGREAPVTVTLHTSGAVESTAKPVTVQLADGGEETILLPLTAKVGLGGAATITVTATSGAESRRVVTELPVRPALPFRRVLALGGLSGEESQMAAAAEDFEPDTILRTVTLGRLPLVRFSGKLEHLLGYPHGCAEQTTSKAFPLIRFDDLARTLAPKLIDKQGPAFMVQSAIMRLRSMQTDDGGFAFWPGEETPDPWVSAYVTHFLLEAGQAGFNAPGMQEPAQNYMAILASQRKDMNACAYALFNLAKAGMADRGSMDELRDKRLTSLTPLARTLLACAYSLAGDAESFNVLLKNLPEIKTGRDTGGRMGSELRDSSLMLLALMDVNPEDILIPKLAAQVSQLMSTDAWGTTQENALAFAALGKVLQQADTGPISGTLVVGDMEYPFTDAMVFTQDKIASGAPVSVRLASHAGTVYWSVSTRGVPAADAAKPISQGLEIRRSFLNRNGGNLDITHLAQGELVLMKTELKATDGNVENVVVQCLLPAGLEVENPRLETTEVTAFAPEDERPILGHQDLRDDRILFFTDLNELGWHAGYTQLRAVTPGNYALPPVQAEAMYDPSILGVGKAGRMDVTTKE